MDAMGLKYERPKPVASPKPQATAWTGGMTTVAAIAAEGACSLCIRQREGV
jgi:hypothetical protein